MPRIAGVDIPAQKRIDVSLQYIYGIGPTRSVEILKKAQIDPSVRANKLTEEEVSKIAGIIENDYVVEGQLRRQVQQNIARLREIRCYRGIRHIRGLPVRGQRTRTNARTRKGPKKTVAGKKGIKEMHRG
ncbi:MAG: 30S ribosomal protein S13 [Phycisphaerae bacterium]|jgi:small subunit ribosomal protein S13|nr:30S ribosomal protein S13 [Phycisphaerae bacterium]